jgi:hypothetical protein
MPSSDHAANALRHHNEQVEARIRADEREKVTGDVLAALKEWDRTDDPREVWDYVADKLGGRDD